MGLVIAVVTVVLVIIIGLAYFCIARKRRRKTDEAAKADREKNKSDGQGENPQLYFQQKVELDDGQRRHEMEAAKLMYEVQGVDEIHELPADKGDGRYARQELKGDECSRRNSRSPDEQGAFAGQSSRVNDAIGVDPQALQEKLDSILDLASVSTDERRT